MLMLVIMMSSLPLDLQRPPLQIRREPSGVGRLVVARNEIRRVGEEVVHFFEGQAGCFGQEEVEEEGVGEVANYEDVVVAVADAVGVLLA